jgi:AsmA protein
MGKLFKYTGILIGIVLLLGVAALLWIALVFDPNAYKPQISAAVKQTTGRELTIDGDIGLSLFPWIGMQLGEITLSNAAGFKDPPFAHINSAEVKLKLLPLLKQEVEMKTVTLHGLRLNLQVAADGRSNWDDLVQPAAEQPPAAPAPEKAAPAAPEGGGINLAALAIGGLEITETYISYDNRSAGVHYGVEGMNLTTGPVSLTDPIDLELNGRFSSSQPEASGTLAFKTRLIADTAKFEQHRLEQMQLKLDFDSPAFASRGSIALNGNIEADLAQERYQINNMVLQTNLENAALPAGKLAAKVTANVEADLKQQTANIPDLQVNAYNLNINGQLQAHKLLSTPEFGGELAIAQFNGRKLLQSLGMELPEMADTKALTQVAVSLGLNGTPTEITLKPLTLTLDDSTLQGSLEAKLAADKPLPALRYTLSLDAIDADRYLPPPSEAPTPVAPPGGAAAAAATLPTELLRGLDIDGALDIGKLKISGLHVSEIKLPIKAQNGLITSRPQARLYEGQYKGNLQLDARNEVPRFKVDESVNGIQAGPLLKDMLGDDMLSGKGSMTAKLTTKGNAVEEMTRNLNGDLTLLFSNGNLKNFNLAQMVREAKARLKKEPLPPKSNLKGTDFTELRGTFKVINGVIHNDDLATKAPFVRIDGKGTADLVRQKLDYLVTAAVVKTEQGEGGAELADLKGIPIPVRIRGSFSKPKFDLQYDELLKARAKQELDRAKTEAKQRLEEKKAAAQLKLEQERLRKEEELKKKQQELIKKKEDELKDKLKDLFKR